MRRVERVPQATRAARDTFWAEALNPLLQRLGAGESGLSDAAASAILAKRRLRRHHRHGRASWLRLLLSQFSSPIMLILIVATIISMLVGDVTDGSIIIAIIIASGALGFTQEFRANKDVAALFQRVEVQVPVIRSGREVDVPLAEVVPGDLVQLRAGGVVPADCRLLECESLLVDESTLTGESLPAEKDAARQVPAGAALADRANSVFLGTHVVSGTGRAVAVLAERDTELGAVSSQLEQKRVTTAFTRGTTRFGVLLIWIMVLLTAFIFVVNTAFGRPILEALLFSLALAVGLSPQMLPAIISISLSTGARRMAEQQVIVKRLDAIEDFGALTVLCTDKTGTLTEGSLELEHAFDVDGRDSDDVLHLASLNAGLQRGFPNPLDLAVLNRRPLQPGTQALDEVPYDFSRRRLSVLVRIDEVPTLIVKGAFESVLSVCEDAVVSGTAVPMETVRPKLLERFAELSADGLRVLAVATRRLQDPAPVLTAADESGLTLIGMLAFRDPVKPDAAASIASLEGMGVSVRLITGDNRLVAAAVGRSVGLEVTRVLTGPEIDLLDDAALVASAKDMAVFADVEPLQKRRILIALRTGGETVGYLGDGINDAPALHAADVGISVDTAVDVAKQAAGVVLLGKSLGLLGDGIRLGRATFANTLKYVRVTTSANFGNMLSMAVASLFLTFLPLLPRQILLLNFLSDIPATTIAADRVDPEHLHVPGRWDLRGIRNFMVVFGLVSTAFDLATFAMLLWVFQTPEDAFRSSWFIESTLTELVVLLSLRTGRPIFRSRPGRALLWSSVLVAGVTLALPYVPPVAGPLGLEPVAWQILVALFGLTAAYLLANELLKRRFLRAHSVRLPESPAFG